MRYSEPFLGSSFFFFFFFFFLIMMSRSAVSIGNIFKPWSRNNCIFAENELRCYFLLSTLIYRRFFKYPSDIGVVGISKTTANLENKFFFSRSCDRAA